MVRLTRSSGLKRWLWSSSPRSSRAGPVGSGPSGPSGGTLCSGRVGAAVASGLCSAARRRGFGSRLARRIDVAAPASEVSRSPSTRLSPGPPPKRSCRRDPPPARPSERDLRGRHLEPWSGALTANGTEPMEASERSRDRTPRTSTVRAGPDPGAVPIAGRPGRSEPWRGDLAGREVKVARRYVWAFRPISNSVILERRVTLLADPVGSHVRADRVSRGVSAR